MQQRAVIPYRTVPCHVLEYGVRATVFYGSLREQMGENDVRENLQEACHVLTEISEHLRKPPGTHGIMQSRNPVLQFPVMANLRTKILDFRGFDPNMTLISRGGIPMSADNFRASLSQRILVLRFLAWRQAVFQSPYSERV